MVNLKRLAALDLVFLGPKIILAEFGLGTYYCQHCDITYMQEGIELRPVSDQRA